MLCAVVPITAFASENSFKVDYDGGSLSDMKNGAGLRLYIDSNQIRLMKDKKESATIPVAAITEISYGQGLFRSN